MNENFKEIVSNISLAMSSSIGIMGAYSGNVMLQVLAFFPALLEKSILNFCAKKASYSNDLRNELNQAVYNACKETYSIISKSDKSLAKFFENVSMRIEHEYSNDDSILHSDERLKQIINDEIKWQEDYIPSNKDIEQIMQLYLENFESNIENNYILRINLIESSVFEQNKLIKEMQDEFFLLKDEINKITTKIYEYRDDNEIYKEKFEEVLFLHKGLPVEKQVRLCDVFVIPEVEVIIDDTYTIAEEDRNNIFEVIKKFIMFKPNELGERQINIMFIEGQAAAGKSSLVSYLAWHYCHKTDFANDLLGEKKLITIKLRDLLQWQNTLDLQLPLSDIYKYLFGNDKISIKDSQEQFKKCFSNSIIILDGFDELCMVESIHVGDAKYFFLNLDRELNKLDEECKVIVTTRPNYLQISKYDFLKEHLVIQFFKEKQRNEWINNYEKVLPIDSSIKKSLSGEFDEKIACIVDTPLALYMIVAKEITISTNMELWELYSRIFLEEVYEKRYDDNAHSISLYKKYFHRLIAEIAKFVSAEEHFFTTANRLLEVEEICELIDKLAKESYKELNKHKSLQDILADCFGIASYFKTSRKEEKFGITKNAIEFYHNNIKDFFCCEYIWFILQQIYANIPNSKENIDEWFMSNFQKTFQFTVFLKDSGTGSDSNMILKFFLSKVQYFKKNKIYEEFLFNELNNSYFCSFFGKMLSTGMIYNYKYNGKENVINMMINTYVSVLSIYRCMYLPFLNKGETLPLISTNEQAVKVGTSFIYRILVPSANMHDNSFLNFQGIMLSGIDFSKHNFSHASFKDCLLIGCKFTECDLRGTDFTGSDLSNADLRNSYIDSETIFCNTTFQKTRILREQQKFFSKIKNDLFIIEDKNKFADG